MRVRSATRQKARVRAKCVRAKVVGCGVRACRQKSVTPNTLPKSKQLLSAEQLNAWGSSGLTQSQTLSTQLTSLLEKFQKFP